jgi:radical SAM protein with 4Fe4S-binding SPASM domain
MDSAKKTKYLKILFDFMYRPLTSKVLPIHLQVESTTACNLNCIMCPRRSIIEKPTAMTFESFTKIYNQVRPLRINLSGLGEPLLNTNIFEMSSYCSANGSIVNMPTNFLSAGEKLDQITTSGISQLKISIDAADRNTYRTIRGANRFEEIINSIKALEDLKEKLGITKPELRFNFAVQRENFGELVDVIKLADHLKVSTVYFQCLEFINMEEKKPEIVGEVNVKSLFNILIKAARTAREKRIKTNLNIWIRDLKLYENKMWDLDNQTPNNKTCYFPWFSAYIEVNGNVRPCPHFMFTPNEGKMGNVFEQSFESIWNNEPYRKLRHAFKRRHHPYTPCKTCIPQGLFDLLHISSRLLPRN